MHSLGEVRYERVAAGKALTTPNARRDAVVRAMRGHDILKSRVCVLAGVDPKIVRRERRPDNPEICKAMQEIAAVRRRFGYRRIGLLLERRGMLMNSKKLYRLYREEERGDMVSQCGIFADLQECPSPPTTS